MVDGEFSPEARAFWDAIPRKDQNTLLANVWCGQCSTTTITRFKGTIEKGDLVLRGYCILCGHRVGRVIEAPDED